MTDRTFLIVLLVLGVLSFALGIWIGLGYPGRHDRYEDTGARAPRTAPFRQLLSWFGGRRRGRGTSGSRGRRVGTGRWSRR